MKNPTVEQMARELGEYFKGKDTVLRVFYSKGFATPTEIRQKWEEMEAGDE